MGWSTFFFMDSGIPSFGLYQQNKAFFLKIWWDTGYKMDKNILFCLVVEDEPLAQQILEKYLECIEELQLVAKCETIEEALMTLQSEQIDVVFLDIQLEATLGTEIIGKMKQLSRRYYIVVTSARPAESLDTRKIFNQKNIIFVDYLTKPFSFDRFHAAIRKILTQEMSNE